MVLLGLPGVLGCLLPYVCRCGVLRVQVPAEATDELANNVAQVATQQSGEAGG